MNADWPFRPGTDPATVLADVLREEFAADGDVPMSIPMASQAALVVIQKLRDRGVVLGPKEAAINVTMPPVATPYTKVVVAWGGRGRGR